MASNPNQKNTQKQKTGIKTKNKHTIEFTNNTPTLPNQTHQKPAGKAKKEGHHRGHKGRGDERKIYTPNPHHVKPKPREPAHITVLGPRFL